MKTVVQHPTRKQAKRRHNKSAKARESLALDSSAPAAQVQPAPIQTQLGHPPCQKLTVINTLKHQLVKQLPTSWRERCAEIWLRRPGTPGPAIEHAQQYLLSLAKTQRKPHHHKEATTIAGADSFYAKQYRQLLNPVMGAFAMTATQALLGAGGSAPLLGRRSYRRTYAALIAQSADIMPIMVLNKQTVAIPLLLPALKDGVDATAILSWLKGTRAMPNSYKALVTGEAVRCHHHQVQAYERSVDGSLIALVDAVRLSRKLTVLALHPHDPDAMGLHITLFGIAFLHTDQLVADYGLSANAMNAQLATAHSLQRELVYCVGGTEEVFTQCSQNLFAKIPLDLESIPCRAKQAAAWCPAQPLERLMRSQFEMIQVTVSSTGLPGASPRNGDQGKAAFMAYCQHRPVLLIPYHPGNAIHGHAAKLWSNPYASIIISDDHTALTRVIISGPSRVLSHEQVQQEFPTVAEAVAAQTRRSGLPVAEPEYWFLQEVAELIQEREPLPANQLTPNRKPCTINAGGLALHNKKPAYFAADSLPAFDQRLHHVREQHGRPLDPEGMEHREWLESVAVSLAVRQKHLEEVLNSMPVTEDKLWSIRS